MTRHGRILFAIILALIAAAIPQRAAGSGPAETSPPPSAVSVGPCGLEQPTTLTLDTTRRAEPTPAPRAETTMKAHPTIGAIGGTINLRAALTLKDGTPVRSHTVHFRIDGQHVGIDKTDGKGEAKLPYKVPNAFGAKKIEAYYVGSQTCAPSKDDANLGTVKSSTKMTLSLLNPNEILREGNMFMVNGKIVRITDQGGLDGREIPVKVDGKHLSNLATSSSGSFSLTYTIPDGYGAKNGSVEASFAGDTLYAPTAATLAFTVHPDRKKAVLTWTGAEGKVGQTVTVDAHLTEAAPLPQSGKGIGGKTVRFWRDRGSRWGQPHIDAKTLGTATTNNIGVAKLSFKIEDLPLGFSVYAHVDGAPEFDIEKKSARVLDVHKTQVTVAISGPGEGAIGPTLAMKARVRRQTDDAPVKNVDVGFPGGTQKTNASGEVSFNYVVSAGGGVGPRTIEAHAQEGPYSLTGTGFKTIQAKPKTN